MISGKFKICNTSLHHVLLANSHSLFLLLKVCPDFGCGFILPHAAYLFQKKWKASSVLEINPHWLIPLPKVIDEGT